jgi:hypothetical protein
MGKQINQYTKTRLSTTITLFDYLDFDSTEDSGTTFESAKLTVDELMKYLNTNVATIYNANRSISADRTLFANTFFTKWDGGDVGIEMADAINDYGFFVNDNVGTEKARLGFDQTSLSAILDLADAGGNFFNLKAGKLGLNVTAVANLDIVGTGATHVVWTKNSSNVPLFYAAESGFIGIKTTTQSGLLENIRINGNTLIGTHYLSSNGCFIDSGGNTNTKNFWIKNNTDNEYFTVTSSAGEGRLGIHNPTPHPSAIIDLTSTTMGLLLPRMTSTEASAITPVNGLCLYVTDTNGTFTSIGFWGYEGGTWVKL